VSINLQTDKELQKITNLGKPSSGSSIRTKGKIIDVQYEVFKVDDSFVGIDVNSTRPGIDGLATLPTYSKSQWLNGQ
jgi:hypothetical protein